MYNQVALLLVSPHSASNEKLGGPGTQLCTSMLYATICNSHKAVPQHTNWDGGLELSQNAFQSSPIGKYIIYGPYMHICRCPTNTLNYFEAHTGL